MTGKQLQVSKETQAMTQELVKHIGFNPLESVFRKAGLVLAVKNWMQLPEIMSKITQLEGKSAGFSTDLAQKGLKYRPEVLAVCVSDALIKGAQLTNNEFGIIKGNLMLQKSYYQRQINELGDENNAVTKDCRYRMLNHDIAEDDIITEKGVCRIPYTVTLNLYDKLEKKNITEEYKRTITVPIKSGDTADAWLGKGKRRILMAIFEKYSGMHLDDEIPMESEAQTVEPEAGIEVGGKAVKVPEDNSAAEVEVDEAEIVEEPEKKPSIKKAVKKAVKRVAKTPKKKEVEPIPEPIPEPEPEPVPEDEGEPKNDVADEPPEFEDDFGLNEDDLFGEGEGNI